MVFVLLGRREPLKIAGSQSHPRPTESEILEVESGNKIFTRQYPQPLPKQVILMPWAWPSCGITAALPTFFSCRSSWLLQLCFRSWPHDANTNREASGYPDNWSTGNRKGAALPQGIRLWPCPLAFTEGTQSYFLLPILQLPSIAHTQAQVTDPDFADLVVEYGMNGMKKGEWSFFTLIVHVTLVIIEFCTGEN